MNPLNNQQKELLFDYCMGLVSREAAVEAGQLISSNAEAAEIYSMFKAAISPLDSLEPEACPDELVESTVGRLNNAARSSQAQLEQLLAAEQARTATTASWFWGDLGKRLAIAAMFMIVGGFLITAWNTGTRMVRQNAWQQQCRMQLGSVFGGMSNYSADHDGELPTVAMAHGSPWWKVGYQGKENHSNTRHVWLLVKRGYLNPANFVCPGIRFGQGMALNPIDVQNLNDFPARRYITYSLQLRCSEPVTMNSVGAKALMSDLNPLFESLPQNYTSSLNLQLNKKLLNLNSINHNRCGQNVLFGDGSVRFIKRRRVGIAADDIFTLQNTSTYQGTETPASEADTFLAP